MAHRQVIGGAGGLNSSVVAIATPLKTPPTPLAPNVTAIMPTQLLVEWSHHPNLDPDKVVDQYRVLLNAGQEDYRLFGVGQLQYIRFYISLHQIMQH